jgi:trigger factor
MEIIKEQINELNAQLKIQLTEADLNPKIETSLTELRKKSQLKGFRPGKVPMGLVKKMYGKAVMYEEMNKMVSETLTKYLTDEKLDIIGEPIPTENQETIDFDNQKEYNFSFDLGLRPVFELSLNKKVKIPFYNLIIDDEMISKQVDSYLDRYGKLETIDEVTEKAFIKGTIVQLDENGEVVEGGISKDNSSISINHIKDEETKNAFIGKKRDDVVVIDIKKALPTESEVSMVLGIPKEEAEKIDSKFQYTIQEITDFIKAELNEDLFKKVFPESEITTEEDFKAKVKTQIGNSTVKESDYKFHLDVKDKVVEKTEISLPEEFLKRWIKLRDEKNELTDEKLNEEFPKIANDLKWQLIINKIVKDNDLKVEFDEVKNLAIEMTEYQFHQYYGLPLGAFPKEELEKYATDLFLKKEEEVKKLYERKFEEKAVAFIKESVKLDEKEVTVEEFNKLFSEN